MKYGISAFKGTKEKPGNHDMQIFSQLKWAANPGESNTVTGDYDSFCKCFKCISLDISRLTKEKELS